MENRAAYVRFRAALGSGDFWDALETARSMAGLLPLVDALELVLLAAKADDRVFEKMAARWLARVTVEKELELAEVLSAAEQLRSARTLGSGAFKTLARLL